MTAWTVAILSSREAPAVLAATAEAAVRAVGGQDAVIDIVVNGNAELAASMAALLPALPLAAAPLACVRLWELPLGDKAHAWNSYLHAIWPDSDLAFFLDGYVAPRPDAFALIAEGLRGAPGAIAATGVPSVGRTARQMRDRLLREGGLHGNLHALRGETMRRFRDAGFRLPLGLYRTDALLNSSMSFNLDPARHEWDRHRVLVHPEASWTLRPLSWYRPRDLLAHLRRMLRQGQGELEKRAFGDHLANRRLRPEGLPGTAVEMVAGWLRDSPDAARQFLARSPLLRLAARRLLARPRDWAAAREPPRLVAALGALPGSRTVGTPNLTIS